MPKKKIKSEEVEEVKDVPLPGEGEVLGVVIQMLGANWVRVKCADGYIRDCRIPGRMRKRVWIKEGDIVVVAPWDFQFEKRGDVTWRYTKAQVQWLEEKGYLKDLQEE
ncbi:MAG: translation initiation factor eIF-1A [Candidatus Baldrarchaeia archaeon]